MMSNIFGSIKSVCPCFSFFTQKFGGKENYNEMNGEDNEDLEIMKFWTPQRSLSMQSSKDNKD